MACVDIGKLRAYSDGELAASEAHKLEKHIGECARCKAQLEEMRQTRQLITAKLPAIAPLEIESSPRLEASLASLRQKMASRSDRRGAVRRLASLFAGMNLQWRVAMSGLVTLIVVASLVALPPVRSAATDLLGVFRVQQFTPVTVDPTTLASIPMLDPREMGTFEGMSQSPKVYSGLTVADAASKVDFPVRLPTQLPAGSGQPSLSVIDSFSFSFTFDMAKTQAYLDSMSLTGIALPKTLDGKKVTATSPSRLNVEYGGAEGTVPSLLLSEGKSPILDIPDSVNTDEVRNAILSFPGLPPELVVQLRALDWKTTAPVPVLKGDTSKKLTVDGADGLFIHDNVHNLNLLVWQKEDVVYAMGGNATEADLIAAANSMR